MSKGAKAKAPASRTRPTGGRRNSQSAMAEEPAVQRSTRSRSDAAPATPEPAGTRGSRKAATSTSTSKSASSQDLQQVSSGVSGPSGVGRESDRGGEAGLSEEGWGLQRTRESISTYGSRVMSHLREYEEASKTTRRLREELRCARARADSATKLRRPAIMEEILRIKGELEEVEKRREAIRENSGPFKEKLSNEDRFREMAEEKERRLTGLQPLSQVDEDMEDGDQQDPPGSLQHHQQAPDSGLPAGQAVMSPSWSSADSGEDSDSSGQGGALMARIRMQESPMCPQNFVFGHDLPEEAPGGSKRRRKKKSGPKLQEVVSYIFTPLPVTPEPAAGSARCASPVTEPGPGPAVDSVQRCGETTNTSRALRSVPVCGSRDRAGKASAEKPDSVGGKAPGNSGAVVHLPVGGGGGSVPGVVAGAPVAPKGAAGASSHGPPTRLTPRNTHEKVLFCIGASDPIDQRRMDGAAAEGGIEGTNKSRVGVAPKQTKQASRFFKGPEACPVGASPALVPRNTSAAGQTSSIPIPGPASVHEGGGSMSGGVSGGAGPISARVTGGAGVKCDGAGTGPVVPPVVAAPVRSYASVTAGGGVASSSSPGSGDGVLQRRLLEALKKGESSISVEGREVDLSFWIERHGLGAFREERGGETAWSLPTAGPGGARRNVARLRWRGSDACPPRSRVVELLLKMGFKATDIFALIHPYGTPEFDVSFVRPEGLELFWSNYELVENEPGWRDFAVQAVSRQNTVKKVTVLTRNESLSCYDIMTWLGRYGEVVEVPKKNRDEFGIWSGAWTFMIKLKRSGNTVAHIPSAAFLGRDRILIFYQGQPKLCHRCGDPTHFSANCTVQKCALCGGVGHLAASCAEIRCNLCGDLGHPFSRCPRAFANAVRTPVGESREVSSAGEGTSRGGGTEGPGRKSRTKTPAQLRRLEKRQKDRELGATPGPVLEADLAAEAPQDDELDEEVRRIRREEEATSSESSHNESMDQDGRRWLEEKRKQGARKKKKGDLRSSPTPARVPKEGKTDSPLGLSNRFLALSDNSSSEEEEAEGEVPEVAVAGPTGGAEPSSPGDVRSRGGGAGPEPGDGDRHVLLGEMDTSVSLKRGQPSDTEGKGGSGKKKAV